jgi:hypothetical protein
MSNQSEAGKGDSPRPFTVDQKVYEDNWNRIFGRKNNDFQDILSTEDTLLNSLDTLNDYEKNQHR